MINLDHNSGYFTLKMNWKICGKVHVFTCFKKEPDLVMDMKGILWEKKDSMDYRDEEYQKMHQEIVKKKWSWFSSSFYILKIRSSHLHPHTQSLQSCWTLWLYGPCPTRCLCRWNSPGKNTGMCCQTLLLGNLPDPGIKPTCPPVVF